MQVCMYVYVSGKGSQSLTVGISHVFGMNACFILKLLPGLSSYLCASFSFVLRV